MDLLNRKVKHPKFGVGSIISQGPDKVTVSFDVSIGDKVFQYPDGFEKFLIIEDEKLEESMNSIIAEKREKEREKEREEQEEQKKANQIIRFNLDLMKKQSSKSRKNILKDNISIKCNYSDGGKNDTHIGYNGVCSDEIMKYNIKVKKHTWCAAEDSKCKAYLNGELSRTELDEMGKEEEFSCNEAKMLNNWRAYAGVVQTGVKKGQAMTFSGLNSNMFALLSTRLPKAKEEERIIFAVFLIDGNYEGSEGKPGYIDASPEYRIKLSLEEAKQVKYWDYYFDERKPEVVKMGSGLHRNITDYQAAQVLLKIVDIKTDEEEKACAQKLLDHFCAIKNIDVNSIPQPEGALLRNKEV